MLIELPDITMRQLIETKNKNGEKEFFVLDDDDNWIKINEMEYNRILRGNNNG